uniref:LanC-like protein GCL2 n=1 Tax=Quercus lobata TaxID=97700 RepID=A0A7N2MC95_QUELO
MADRFFPNVMPDFVAEATAETQDEEGKEPVVVTQDSLMKLLSMPYSSLSQRFKRAALDLKETITLETWGMTGQQVQDFTLYVTFLCGRAGVCALGAVLAKHARDEQLLNCYLVQFREIKLPRNLPDELLYGRVGYLWACLFINKHMGAGTIPSTYTCSVVNEIIKNGRELAKSGRCPLMFEWYGEKYWGAAHGLTGIMHVLMDMDLKPDEVEDVKGTLRYMINNQFPSGNYPASEEDIKRDVLVHWCHGAPGVALTLVKEARVFGDKEFLEAAADAAEVVWNRGLLKRVRICHGISGNAYVFLSLYQLTMWSSYAEPKLLLAFYLIELTSSYQRETCMEVITPTHCSKGWEVWLIFFLT